MIKEYESVFKKMIELARRMKIYVETKNMPLQKNNKHDENKIEFRTKSQNDEK